jgi:glycerol-3-phosphate dehydrogenase
MLSLGELSMEQWDALVVGAGIAGTAAAYDLASRGYRTLLVDKADIGSGTSQASTNLIHGGLRYLKRLCAGFGLVRRSLRERNWLLQAAPHLVRPIEIVLPVYGRSPDSRLALKVGLTLYDWLSGGYPARHEMLSAEEVVERVRGLATEGLRGGAAYTDCQARPERLCLAYAKSAEAQGAMVRTYLECTDIRPGDDTVRAVFREPCSGETISLESRCLVNASGPWLDAVRRSAGIQKPALTLTKGIHIIHPLIAPDAVYAPSPVDGRYVFVLPWRGHSLIGTTDTRHDASPDTVLVEAGDARYLLDSAKALFPGQDISADRIVTFTAGLRPLQYAPRSKESDISRDYRIIQDGRMLSLIGVKLTMARAAAEDLGGRVNKLLRHDKESGTLDRPLHGGTITRISLADPGFFSREQKANYGSEYEKIRALAEADPALAEPLCSCRPTLLAEAAYAARHEHVQRAEDFLRRRTRSDLCECGRDIASRAVPILAAELGWGENRQWAEIEAWNRQQEWIRAWRYI